MGFFWLVPLIGSFEESLSLSPQLVGKIASEEQFTLMNYGRALNDGKFIKSLENTLIFVTSTVAITLSIGFFFLACALFGIPKLLRGFSLFLLLIPSLALPGTLANLFYLFFHGKSGALNQFLIIPLGLEPINWMMNPVGCTLSYLSGSLEMDRVNHVVAVLWYEGDSILAV